MEELVTIDTILNWLKASVEQKRIIGAHTWVDACQKLNIFISDEHDKLFELQRQVANLKVGYIEEGKSVVEAKTRVEAGELYRDMQKQKARIEMIEEAIKIAKIQARLKDTEMRNY